MKAQIVIDMDQYQQIEARVRAALHDLGDKTPDKQFVTPNEDRDILQQRVYSSVQCLRQLLSHLTLR